MESDISKSLENIDKKLDFIKDEGILVRDIFSTKSRYLGSTAVNTTSLELLKIKEGIGIIKELFLSSNSANFTIHMIVDDVVVYDQAWATFTFFNTNDTFLGNVITTAGGTNYLTIQDIQFKKNVFIKVVTTANVTFNVIFTRMDIRGEKLIEG